MIFNLKKYRQKVDTLHTKYAQKKWFLWSFVVFGKSLWSLVVIVWSFVVIIYYTQKVTFKKMPLKL